MTRGKVYLLIFVVAAFFVGTGYGVYVMNAPSNNTSEVAITVSDSAFPTVNNTTTNQTINTITKTATVKKTTTTKTATSPNKTTTTTKKNNNTG